jgi:hypothetical protein
VKRRHRALLSLIALLIAGSARNAAADETAARAHFDKGLTLLDAGDHARALEEFRAAYADWQNPKILLNIGTTLRALGRDAEAANAYARYLRESGADEERAAEAKAVLDEIDPRVGRLDIVLAAPDAQVFVDGTRSAEWHPAEPLRIAPGSHEITAQKQGLPPAVTSVSVAAGERRSLDLTPKAASQPAAQPEREMPTAPVVDHGTTGAREDLSHADQLGAFIRADIDGEGQGAVMAPGVSFGIGGHIEPAAAGLIGRHKGAWAGVRLFALRSALKPSLLLGSPVFFVDGARVGLQGSLGLLWDASRHVGAFVDVGIVHFPSPPDGYQATFFVPSVGIQARL